MQLASAENVQHAFQIVGGYRQADFRLRSPQSTQQEAWMWLLGSVLLSKLKASRTPSILDLSFMICGVQRLSIG